VKNPRLTKVVKNPRLTKVVKNPRLTKVVKNPRLTKVVKNSRLTKVVKNPRLTKLQRNISTLTTYIITGVEIICHVIRGGCDLDIYILYIIIQSLSRLI